LGFVLHEDSIINNVDCPTKLVEPLRLGIIPIVDPPFIRDFTRWDTSYILVNDFVNGTLPDPIELNTLRERNCQMVQRLEELSDTEFTRMRDACLEG
jgi:hypothetical protein